MNTETTQAETVQSTPFAGTEGKTTATPLKEKEQKVTHNNTDNKKAKKGNNKGDFEFPDGGWECSKC